MRTKLWIFLAAFALLFSACEKDDELKGRPDFAVAGQEIITLSSHCISDGVTPLIAGQHYEVGTVTVEFENDNIVVTYKTIQGWFITETHLHIAANLAGIPTNRGGNPRIGNFDYGDDYLDPYTNEVSYTIAKADILPSPVDGSYFIAAHAVVNGAEGEGDVVDLDAFNALFPEGPINVNLGGGPAPGNSSYYDNLTISGGSFLDGVYDKAWCIEGTVFAQYIAEPTAYSTYGFLPEGIVSFPQNFDKVNWLLNNVYAGMDDGEFVYTWGDIQMALYGLLDEKEPMYLEFLYLEGYNTDVPQDEQPWWNKVAKLIQMAETKGIDFVPGCGELIAIALDYGDKQNILITYPLPCYPEGQEETAWGQGSAFTERGSWAMYFKVCE